MATYLFDLFKFARLLDMTDGKMSLMGTPVNIVPTDLLCEQQKMLIKSIGLEKAYEEIYTASKKGSFKYNQDFIEKEHFKDKRKIIDWQTKIVTLSGWGEVEMALTDLTKKNFTVHFNNSPYPKSYGSAKYAVDFIATGFVAGGLSVVAESDLDAVEVKCLARGDPFCELEIGTKRAIDKRRSDLWKKWGVI